MQIIIVDDASTDSSAEVIKEYVSANKNLNIKFIQLEKNGGPAIAKGTALEHAKGEYVIFVDCDDWMDENCLQVLSARAMKTGADKIKSKKNNIMAIQYIEYIWIKNSFSYMKRFLLKMIIFF